MSILEVKNLSHTYSPNTPFAKEALKDINLSIDRGDFVGIVGHTCLLYTSDAADE